MTISATDIKLKASERLTDNPDGGGRMTGNEIVDGQLNNLFQDISTLDRVAGRVSMKKGFVHVSTSNTDVLYGAFGIVTNPPADDSVFVSMFSTGDYADERASARNRVESYVIKGPESRLILYGDHFIGQRTLSFYTQSDAPSPEVNEVYDLSIEDENYTPLVQFVRIKEVLSRASQTFVDERGTFSRDVIQVEITTELIHDFPGGDVSRFTSVRPPTLVRTTQVADAASYYSVRPLAQAASSSDLQVVVDTPYVSLVPSSQTETPVVDALAGLGTATLAPSGPADSLTWSGNISAAAGASVTRYLGSPFAKGSLTVTIGTWTLHDDGHGGLEADGSVVSPYTGVIDYQAGSVILSSDASWNESVTLSAQPAGALIAQAITSSIYVTSQNRQYTYVENLQPTPAPGTLAVDYRALGQWIRLSDNGAGQLVGQPGQGTGTINYATGSVSLTLGALPDTDSAIVFQWGTPQRVQDRSGDVDIEPPYITQTLSNQGLVPGTVTVSWLESGVTKQATDDGVGNLTGDATGRVVYSTGEVGFQPTTLPDAGSQVTYDYDWADQQDQTFTLTADGAGSVSFSLANTPVRPGSFRARWTAYDTTDTNQIGTSRRTVVVEAWDDGAGNLEGIAETGTELTGLGTIDYATGNVVLQVENTVETWMPTYAFRQTRHGPCGYFTGYNFTPIGLTFQNNTPVSVDYVEDSAANTTVSEQIQAPPAVVDLTPTAAEPVVPGAVRFTFRGRTYVDRQGQLYYGIDPTTNAGTVGGTMDYASGRATLTDYALGGSNTLSVGSLLTTFKEGGAGGAFFRTPGSPLRAGSFSIRATRVDNSQQISASADIDGNIDGDNIIGEVDWESGVAEVIFGEWVDPTGYEAEPWYDANNIQGGQIFKPLFVFPSTIFFNTVVYSALPLDQEILKLDPVRLPQDGRVTVFKPGDVLVVHNEQTTTIPAPTAGQVVNLGRTSLAQVEVRDSDGTPIDSVWYAIDKDLGTVTFADPLDLSTYTLPVVITDRIEDIVLCSDVQITGEIALSRPLTHDYTAGDTFVSSALVFGDLQSRPAVFFSQETWTGVWDDERIGNNTTAQYNDVLYPVEVENDDAITERWALIFTSTTGFNVVGEVSGLIATGTTGTDTAPVNPVTGSPYFILRKEGWGAGWSSGNVVRFNTIGALAPVWFVRTTLPGETEPNDAFKFQVIGDSD